MAEATLNGHGHSHPLLQDQPIPPL